MAPPRGGITSTWGGAALTRTMTACYPMSVVSLYSHSDSAFCHHVQIQKTEIAKGDVTVTTPIFGIQSVCCTGNQLALLLPCNSSGKL